MLRFFVTLTASAILATTAIAQEDSANPLALDDYREQSGLIGLPTVASVDQLRIEVERLLAEGNCAAAIPVLEEYAGDTNHLANLIGQGLEPFYSAYGEERDGIPQSLIRELIPGERKANELREARNEAWVDHAECLLETGNPELAAARLHQTLGLLQPRQPELWERARNLLWNIVGFSPE